MRFFHHPLCQSFLPCNPQAVMLKHLIVIFNMNDWYCLHCSSHWIKLTFTITNWTQSTQTIITHQRFVKICTFQNQNLRNSSETSYRRTSRWTYLFQSPFQAVFGGAKVLTPCDNRAWWQVEVTGYYWEDASEIPRPTANHRAFGCVGMLWWKPWTNHGMWMFTTVPSTGDRRISEPWTIFGKKLSRAQNLDDLDGFFYVVWASRFLLTVAWHQLWHRTNMLQFWSRMLTQTCATFHI